MKILLATQFLFPDAIGGAGRYVRDLARGLAQRGHEVIVLSPAAVGQPAETMEEGVRFVRCGRFKHTWEVPASWQAWRRVFQVIQPKRPLDLIAVHQALPVVGLLRDPHARHLPWVYHFHSPWAEESQIRRRSLALHPGAFFALKGRLQMERRVLQQARARITLSASMKGILLQTHPAIPEAEVSVVPGCVDLQRFQPAPAREAVRRQLQLPADRAVLLTVRNLVPRMNLEGLLEAMREISRQRPNVLLLIAGDGPLRAALAGLIERWQLQQHVRLLGSLRDAELLRHYQAADLFIMSSKALEGFGLATVEALACGTPVVGTPIGGTQELLAQWDLTLLCKDVQPASMAYTILKTLQRLDAEAPARALRQQARCFAERFSVPAMAEGVERVYLEAARPRVLHVHTLPVISGSGLSTLEAMKGQRDAGYHVELACGPAEGLPEGKDQQASGLVDIAVQERLAVRPVSHLRRPIHPWHDLLAVRQLQRLCRQRRYTLVHTHNSKAGVIGRLAARCAGVPVIVHTVHGFAFHDAETPWRRWLYRFFERQAAGWCDRITIISQPLLDWALRERIAPAERFVKIYSGIDVTAFRAPLPTAALRAQLGLSPEHLVVGEVAKLWEGKGHAVLLHAFAQLAFRRPQARLLLVGEGPLRGALQRMAAELRISDRVIFAGFRTDVLALTHLIDVVVLPSLFEGMGRAVIEAQAAGKPVIGTRVGGIPDLIEDGVSGLLVTAGSVQELADALERLCQDQALRQRLGSCAQQRLNGCFDAKAMAAQILQVYDALLMEKRLPRPRAPLSPHPAAGGSWPEARRQLRTEGTP